MTETETTFALTPATSGPVTTEYDATQWPEPMPLRDVPTELIVCSTRHVEEWFKGGAIEYEDDDPVAVILAAVLPLIQQQTRAAVAAELEAHAESIGWYEGGGVWAEALDVIQRGNGNG